MEITKLVKYLENKYDPKLAEEWDREKIGLQRAFLTAAGQDISTVVVALDLTKAVLQFAIANKAQMIITRHPFLFLEMEQERANPAKKAMLAQLLETKIIPYAIHTNYDSSSNQNMMDLLEKTFVVKKIERTARRSHGFRCRLKNEITLEVLKKSLGDLFKTSSTIRVGKNYNPNQKTLEFYIASGSGGDEMVEQGLTNCVYVTGEAKWNEWIYAVDNNVTMIELGHYMENYFVSDVTARLKNAFGDLQVLDFDIQNMF